MRQARAGLCDSAHAIVRNALAAAEVQANEARAVRCQRKQHQVGHVQVPVERDGA